MKKKKVQCPFVSILVVNFNGKGILETCLPSLFRITYPNDKYEVIIVDNGSTDGSIEFLKKNYPRIKVVQNNKNMGYVGINSGIKICKGEFICFLNNDLTLKKNSLSILVEEIRKDPLIAMVAHTSINYDDKKLVSGGTWVSRTMYCGHYPKSGDFQTKVIPYLGVGLIRKSVVLKFGYLFDPDYFIYAEDLDLGLRIRMLGMKIVLVRDAVIYHMHSATTKRFSTPSRNTYMLERNLLMTFLKIFSAKSLLLYSPLVIFSRLLTVLKDLISLRFGNALARIRAIIWTMLHVSLIARKRHQLQKLRKADDSFILEVFSEKHLLRKPFLV